MKTDPRAIAAAHIQRAQQNLVRAAGELEGTVYAADVRRVFNTALRLQTLSDDCEAFELQRRAELELAGKIGSLADVEPRTATAADMADAELYVDGRRIGKVSDWQMETEDGQIFKNKAGAVYEAEGMPAPSFRKLLLQAAGEACQVPGSRIPAVPIRLKFAGGPFDATEFDSGLNVAQLAIADGHALLFPSSAPLRVIPMEEVRKMTFGELEERARTKVVAHRYRVDAKAGLLRYEGLEETPRHA